MKQSFFLSFSYLFLISGFVSYLFLIFFLSARPRTQNIVYILRYFTPVAPGRRAFTTAPAPARKKKKKKKKKKKTKKKKAKADRAQAEVPPEEARAAREAVGGDCIL